MKPLKLPVPNERDAPASDDSLERAVLVLRRRWLLILGVTILVGLASFGYSQLRHKQYTATAYLLFGSTDISSLDQQVAGVTQAIPTDSQRVTDTNVLLLTQGDTAAATARAVGHGLTPAQVTSSVVVTPQGQSSGMSLAATANSPRLAADIANTYAQQFILAQKANARAIISRARQTVDQQLAAMSKVQRAGPDGQALVQRSESLNVLHQVENGNVQLVRAAQVPVAASSAGAGQLVGLGVLLGLVLGLALAFLLERLDQRVREARQLEQAFGFPVVGHVPEVGSFSYRRSPGEPVTLTEESEAFRMLRAHLRYFNIDRDIKIILMTSVEPGDGKSTVARNLALAAASMDTRTLLIEADLRNPGVARMLGIPSAPGLAETLINRDHGWGAVQKVPVTHRHRGGETDSLPLDVLVAGAIPPNPAELLESEQMKTLVAAAGNDYELVIIDAPPITAVSDAIPLIPAVDGVLLVGRLEKYSEAAARRFSATLTSLEAPVLGVVVNAIKPRDIGYGYGRYGYYASSAVDPSEMVAATNGTDHDAVAEVRDPSRNGSGADHTKVR